MHAQVGHGAIAAKDANDPNAEKAREDIKDVAALIAGGVPFLAVALVNPEETDSAKQQVQSIGYVPDASVMPAFHAAFHEMVNAMAGRPNPENMSLDQLLEALAGMAEDPEDGGLKVGGDEDYDDLVDRDEN